MQIENLSIEARPRTGWQALDLGIMMAQQWYLPLLVCFALPVAVVLVACALLIPDNPNIAMLIIWWFKPLYERIPLSFLSTAIFGEVPTVRQALGRWRSCVPPGLFASLTYLRLSPTRSFKAPILVLEGLSGAAQRKRFQVLNASPEREATWLTILCVHVEAFLNFGLIAFVALFIPEELLGELWDSFLTGQELLEIWATNLIYYLSIVLIGPVYVCAGFALYINRRVELEAWDIELGFRKIVRRLTQAAAAVLLLSFVHVPTAAPAHAEAAEPAEISKTAITEVLESEQYHQKETFSYPEILDIWDWDWNFDGTNARPLDLSWIAVLIEISLWTIGIGIVLWLVYRLGLLQKLVSSSDKTQPMPPEKLFGMALDSPTLPDNILQAADECWQSGDQRAALSLLLRGWLLQMIKRYECRFREGDTEADCLRVVKAQTEPNTHDRFARLISTWQHVAYGHQTTAMDDFDLLRDDWTAQWATPHD